MSKGILPSISFLKSIGRNSIFSCQRSFSTGFSVYKENIASGTSKRFWKHATVDQTGDGRYKIKLDNRVLKIPESQGAELLIDSRQRLFAALIAAEWEAVEKLSGPHTLPLTSMAIRAHNDLDTAEKRRDLVRNLMKYFNSDSILFQSDYPEPLVKLQNEFYNPVLDYVQKKFGMKLEINKGIAYSSQSKENHTILEEYILNNFSPLKLAAFEKAVITSKSLLISLAMIERYISVEDAAKASRVETLSQLEYWGYLENAHDLEESLLLQTLGASACAVIGT